ncbi:hypothetical protein DL93DRAFT_1315423 [Clavulina sp. PMI_390]|nr:hypothetical protein DL93DRAFT_1315423 [Clavulina sp. PMI_390]
MRSRLSEIVSISNQPLHVDATPSDALPTGPTTDTSQPNAAPPNYSNPVEPRSREAPQNHTAVIGRTLSAVSGPLINPVPLNETTSYATIEKTITNPISPAGPQLTTSVDTSQKKAPPRNPRPRPMIRLTNVPARMPAPTAPSGPSLPVDPAQRTAPPTGVEPSIHTGFIGLDMPTFTALDPSDSDSTDHGEDGQEEIDEIVDDGEDGSEMVAPSSKQPPFLPLPGSQASSRSLSPSFGALNRVRIKVEEDQAERFSLGQSHSNSALDVRDTDGASSGSVIGQNSAGAALLSSPPLDVPATEPTLHMGKDNNSTRGATSITSSIKPAGALNLLDLGERATGAVPADPSSVPPLLQDTNTLPTGNIKAPFVTVSGSPRLENDIQTSSLEHRFSLASLSSTSQSIPPTFPSGGVSQATPSVSASEQMDVSDDEVNMLLDGPGTSPEFSAAHLPEPPLSTDPPPPEGSSDKPTGMDDKVSLWLSLAGVF